MNKATYLNLLLRLALSYFKNNLKLVGIYSIVFQLFQSESEASLALKVAMIEQLLQHQKKL